MVLVWVGVIILTFIIANVVPRDPVRLRLGPRATADQVAALRKEYGLDLPLPMQFIRYVENLAQGNLGTSLWSERPVLDDLVGVPPDKVNDDRLYRGLDELLPPEIELAHGPGCPVCVTPVELVDKAVAIASRSEVIFCSFGDMLRVPGSGGDLFQVKSRGGDVRIVYSPLDAVKLARAKSNARARRSDRTLAR